MKERIEYLESLIPQGIDIEDMFYEKFERYSSYLGNGVYNYRGLHSTDTRELFLMTCLSQLNITYDER